MMGAATGFLWWNASPARIFMGDTGALATACRSVPRAHPRPPRAMKSA